MAHKILSRDDERLIRLLKDEKKKLKKELSYLSDRALGIKFNCSHRTIGRV